MSNANVHELESRLHRLEHLNRVSLALNSAASTEDLIETIVLQAKGLCRADGATFTYGKATRWNFGFCPTTPSA